jgi:hypothetical protein
MEEEYEKVRGGNNLGEKRVAVTIGLTGPMEDNEIVW